MTDQMKLLRPLGFLSLVFLISFAMVGFWAYPQVDDYWYIDRAMNFGVWESIISEYFAWTGRYTATFFLSLSPLGWGKLLHYRFIPLILISFSFISNYVFFKVIFRKKIFETILLSLIFTFIYYSGMPAITQNLYWWAGSSTYNVPTILFTFLIATYFSHINPRIKVYLSLFLMMLIIGCNETSMVMLCYLCSCMLFFDYVLNKKFKIEHIVYFIWCLFWGIVVLKAPGNTVRASEFEKSHRIFRTVSNAFLYSFIYPVKCLAIPMIASLPLWFNEWKNHPWSKFIQNNQKWFILMLLGFFFMTFAPSLWGMGRKPNARTMGVIYHGYVAVVFPLLAAYLKEEWIKKIPQWATVIFFCISINTCDLVGDFVFDRLSYYDERWKKVIASKTLVIPELEMDKTSKMLYFNDVKEVKNTVRRFIFLRPDFFN